MLRPVIALLATLAIALLVSGCEAGDPRYTAADPAGFWNGLWHGVIALPALVISLFVDQVDMYETANNGRWYDFGFLLGIILVSGGGGRGSRRR
jgi:hypothetical protein